MAPRRTLPPWGLSEPNYRDTCSEPRCKTRSEMLRSRREEATTYARDQLDKRGLCPPVKVPTDCCWWKLVEGYKENALEDLASSPRFQRYMSKRARAQAAERPDPFGTHEVRLRRAPKSCAGKISRTDPPPADAEVYLAPKRTVKRFTDGFFEWKARLVPHGDLDERGKNKRVTRDECEPPFSSLSSFFTGCTIDPRMSRGPNIRSPRQANASLQVAAHQPDKPSAAEVARRAIQQQRVLWQVILASAINKSSRDSCRDDDSAGTDGQEGGSSYGSSSSRSLLTSPSSACSTSPTGEQLPDPLGQLQMRSPSVPPETTRRRYSRLCGQS
ncbi:unnamed protein product [Ectocarpus sp. 13 AM-2016]